MSFRTIRETILTSQVNSGVINTIEIFQIMYHLSGFGDVEDDFLSYLPLSKYKLQYRFYHPAKDPYSNITSMLCTVTVMKNDPPRPRPTRPSRASKIKK